MLSSCDLSAQVASSSYRLFPVHRSTAYLHFRRAAAAIGLHRDLQHPHTLRHSTAHWMLAGGAALNVTSQYLGHTSLSSTAPIFELL
jgi:site-specific recombinase XerD